ncbi:Taurine catabolism dioxygenase TauD-like protein 4 [Elsinoe fawcettii]|nr:Taurine catabolism dioxygenase TauD-like protein 4 [Elsinoe fawcettii]
MFRSWCSRPVVRQVGRCYQRRCLVSPTSPRTQAEVVQSHAEDASDSAVGPQAFGETLKGSTRNTREGANSSQDSPASREEIDRVIRATLATATPTPYEQPEPGDKGSLPRKASQSPHKTFKNRNAQHGPSDQWPRESASQSVKTPQSLEEVSAGELRQTTNLDAWKTAKGKRLAPLENKSKTRFSKARIPNLTKYFAAGGPLSLTGVAAPEVKRSVHTALLDPIYLRDMCTCELCVDPSSGQKKFWTVDIPESIEIEKRVDLPDGEGYAFSWKHDIPGYPPDHVTQVSDQDLYYHIFNKFERRTRTLESWNRAKLEKQLVVMDYDAYTNDLESYKMVLRAVRDNGLAFVSNVPESEQSVVDIAEKIGPLRNSFYGMTWDVKSVPKAMNVAYTSGHLGFHMDLLYMADPPKLQFLHCLRSSAEGGASLFSDAYQAIEEICASRTYTLKDLRDHQTVFHYNKNGKKYMQNRSLINTVVSDRAIQQAGRVTPFLDHVNWSPPFQGPHGYRALFAHPDSDQLMKWHNIANEFRDRTERPDNVFERKMSPGECVIFDNRRILHARTAFSPGDVGKERWLKGCYVDGDPWESELNVHNI